MGLKKRKYKKNEVTFERKICTEVLYESEKKFSSILPKIIKVRDNKPVKTYSLREIICPNIDQLDTGKLGNVENRLEVAGHNFTIIPNKGKREGMYRALAQALTMNQNYYKYIRRKTIRYIIKNWEFYEEEILEGYVSIIPEMRIPGISNDKLMNIYENHALYSQSSGTFIELHAASKKFKFGFGVMITNNLIPFNVINYYNKYHDTSGVKYYFLLTGDCREDWHWEYLTPIGSLIEIPAGRYNPHVKQAVIFSKFPESSKHEKNLVTEFSRNSTVVISYKEREYYYRMTFKNSLFYILAEILYGNISYANTIMEYIKTRREILNNPIQSAGKKRTKLLDRCKEPHVKVNQPIITKIKLPKLNIFERQGDTTDLKIAANIYNFSFNLFGLDGNNNKFLIEYNCKINPRNNNNTSDDDEDDEDDDDKNINNSEIIVLNLLLKSDEKKRTMSWFLLEESDTLKHLNPSYLKKLLSLWRFSPRRSEMSKRMERTPQNTHILENLPKLSKYESVPLYSKLPSPSNRKSSIFKEFFSKKPNHIVFLIPKNLPNNPHDLSNPIIQMDPKYSEIMNIGFHVEHGHGTRHWYFTHSKSKYHIVTAVKTKPSTLFPMVTHKLAKMELGLIPCEYEDDDEKELLEYTNKYSFKNLFEKIKSLWSD